MNGGIDRARLITGPSPAVCPAASLQPGEHGLARGPDLVRGEQAAEEQVALAGQPLPQGVGVSEEGSGISQLIHTVTVCPGRERLGFLKAASQRGTGLVRRHHAGRGIHRVLLLGDPVVAAFLERALQLGVRLAIRLITLTMSLYRALARGDEGFLRFAG